MRRRALLFAAAFLAAPALPAAGQDVALRVGRLLPGDGGEPMEDVTVLVVDGRIEAIAHLVEVPPGTPVVTRAEAWAVPGFVDPVTALGAQGDTDERTAPLAHGVSAAWALDPGHRDLAAARAAGVTTALLAPGDATLYGGEAVVFEMTGALLDAAAPLAKLTLARSALDDDRPPTSRAGALALLRHALGRGHGGDASELDPGLVAFARGERAGLVRVGTARDLADALDLVRPLGLRCAYLLDPSIGAGDLERVEVGSAPLVLGPLDLETSERTLRLPAALADRGLRLAFASGAPAAPPEALRLSAILAVRAGLDPEVALAAITSVPAELLGVGARKGALAPGKDGDVVLLDGHPLDPASRVLETWVRGRRVHAAPARPGRGVRR